MRFRLNNLEQANFSNGSNGFKPYESKWNMPVSYISVSDTPYTVRSHGLTCRYYKNSGLTGPWPIQSLSNSLAVYQGVVPIVKFWYETGFPEHFSNIADVTSWGIKLTGYFRAEYTGTHTFNFRGRGQLHSFVLNGVQKLTTHATLIESGTSSYTASLTSGLWYTIEIIFISMNANFSSSGFVVTYSTPDMAEPEILSAGVTAKETDAVVANEFPIPYITLSFINKIDLKRNKNQIDQLNFSVPLTKGGSNFQGGYVFDPNNNLYYDITDSSKKIQPFRMVRLQQGYKTDAGVDELVTQFVGQIREIKTNLGHSGDTLDVTAYGFDIFTKDAINKESPNNSDYLAANYLTHISGHVDGSKKPQCYDGWELHKTVKNLMVNSFVDPYLFTKKKIFTNRAGAAVSGSYNIYGMGLSALNYLPVSDNYGNPDFVTGDSDIPDDAYLYKVQTGETYYDTITKFLEPFSMDWGFTSSGYPFVRGYNVPTQTIDDREMAYYSASWSNTSDINAFRATLKYHTTKNAVCSVSATGSKFAVLCRVGPLGGSLSSPSQPAMKVVIRKSGATVSSAGFNLYYNTTRAYYDGVADDLGYNPCILNVGNNLTYDTYNISIVKTTGPATRLDFDSLWAYDEDVQSPYLYFKSGDLSTPASITQLSVGDNSNYLRNESFVIGSRLGTRVAQGEKRVFDTINPNNPIFEHVVSRTIDLNSIYKSTAFNFVGRPLTTLIFDPAINDQDQANFISFNFVDEYRVPNKEVQLSVLNNPLIDIGDCISIKDEGRDTIQYNNKVWVQSLNFKVDQNKTHITSIETTPVQPVTSWVAKQEPDLALFNNNPFINIKIYNTGVITKLNQTLATAQVSTMYVDADLASAPPAGYIQLLRVYACDNDDRPIQYDTSPKIPNNIYSIWSYPMMDVNEIIKYTSRSSAGIVPGKFYGLNRGLQYTLHQTSLPTYNQHIWPINTPVISAWDPYTQDSFGIGPLIKFDLLMTGKIKCIVEAQVHGSNSFVPVDNLAWNGTKEVLESFKKLIWGEGRLFNWGGMDNLGQWNQIANDPLMKVHKSSFCAEEYQFIYPNTPSLIRTKQGYKNYLYNKYRIKLQLIKDDGLIYETTTGYFYTRRGNIGKIHFKINYQGVNPGDVYVMSDGGMTSNFVNIGPLRIRLNNPYPLIFNTNSRNYNGMEYTITESNKEQGSTLYHNDVDIDPDYIRYYGGKITAFVRTITHQINSNTLRWPSDGDFWDDQIEEIEAWGSEDIRHIFNNKKIPTFTGFFSPRKIKSDLSWVPIQLRNKIREHWGEGGYNIYSKFLVNKVIYFRGYFADKSGRHVFQWPIQVESDQFPTVPFIHYPIYPYLELYMPYSVYNETALNDGFYISGDDLMENESTFRGNYICWDEDNIGGTQFSTFSRFINDNNEIVPAGIKSFGYSFSLGDL